MFLGNLPVRWGLPAVGALGPLVRKAIARPMGPPALRRTLNTVLSWLYALSCWADSKRRRGDSRCQIPSRCKPWSSSC